MTLATTGKSWPLGYINEGFPHSVWAIIYETERREGTVHVHWKLSPQLTMTLTELCSINMF